MEKVDGEAYVLMPLKYIYGQRLWPTMTNGRTLAGGEDAKKFSRTALEVAILILPVSHHLLTL